MQAYESLHSLSEFGFVVADFSKPVNLLLQKQG